MGYLSNYGEVGQYRGFDIFVINYTKLTKERSKEHQGIIYAVINQVGDKTADLVLDGNWIGTMTDAGQINMFKAFRWYRFYTGEKEKKKESVKEEEPRTRSEEITPEALASNVTYETMVVDNFFKGLKDLWKEMDKGFKEEYSKQFIDDKWVIVKG